MPFITQGKTNLTYILIIVILAAIVGGGILGYYYSWIKELETKLAEIEAQLPMVKLPENETVNWKTYRSEEWGFEMKYPPHLIPTETTSHGYIRGFYFKNELSALVYMDISIDIGNTTLPQAVGQIKTSLVGHVIDDIKNESQVVTKNGYTGIKLEYEIPPNSDSYSVVILHNREHSFTITARSNYINQILSTFKFLEDGVAGWKTFRGEIAAWPTGEGYKFEFQAPQEFVEIIPYPWIDPEYHKNYYGVEGPGISFFAGPMEGPGLLTTLHWQANQAPLCSNSLAINEEHYGSQAIFEACDVMQIDGRNALFLMRVTLFGMEMTPCQPEAAVYIIQNLDNNGSILFTVELEALKEMTEIWPEIPSDYSFLDEEGGMWNCPPDIDQSKVKESFVTQISSIRNAENLSQEDTEKLKNVYQMLSTFRFLD